MRRTPRALTLGLIIAALVAPGTAAHATRGYSPPIQWAPCEEDPTADCGTLRVPVDWSRPRGETVELALARRTATEPRARIGTLVLNPGGPGGSGVDYAIFGAVNYPPEIRRQFDIIGFDPRGVARSNPVLCSLDLLNQIPSPHLRNQAEFDALVAFNRRLGRDCRTHTGPVFDHLDTISVAHDIDAIRAAVGDRQLSFYGASYGSLMGQQYAELFPHRVRALVLDSNMDHSLGTAAFLDTEAATVQSSFDQFVAGCGRNPRCPLYGRDIRALWHDLLAKADRGELHDPGDPTFTVETSRLIGVTFSSFYGPAWYGLANLLLSLETGQVPGPGAARLPASGATTGGAGTWRGGATGFRLAKGSTELAEYSFQAIFCQDWRLPVDSYRDYARHMARGQRIAPDMRYSPLAVNAVVSCPGWPAKVHNPQHRLRVRGSEKLLLVNSLYDPSTAYSWATNAARQLGRSAVLLTYEGWGHGVYGRGPCTDTIINRYLLRQALPAPGTHCPAVEPPFPPANRMRGAPDALPAGPRPDVPGWS